MKKTFLYLWSLLATVFLIPANVTAQSWTASAPADGTFYLYNVGRQAYLYGANNYDTRASLTQHGGVAFTLAASDDGYLITSEVYQNLYLGGDGYVDKQSTSSSAKPWKFIPVDGLENTYIMQTTKDNSYIVAHNGDASKTSITSTLPTSEMGYWKLVTREDFIASLSAADAEHPIDATLLIKNPNFGRVTDVSCWNGSPAHGGNDGDGGNFCVEKWNASSFDVYQTLTGMPNGVYKVHCQGLYRTGNTGNDATDAAATRKAGLPDELNAMYYINGTEAPLMSIFDYSLGTTNNSTYNSSVAYDIGSTIYVPSNMSRAAMCFLAGEYVNPDIRAVVTDGTVRLGVKKTVANNADWAIFDNFVLTYYGVDMSEMVTQAILSWHSKYDAIAFQALDHSTYDAVLDEAAVTAYCTSETKLAEYGDIVWQTVSNLLKNGTTATGQFDITSLVENPTFETGTGGWDTVGTTNYSGTNGVAEFWNQSVTSLTQTLPNMPEGTYTLKAQAFYRTSGWREAVARYQRGVDEVKGFLMLAGQQQNIWNVYDQPRYQYANFDGIAGGSHQGMAPDNLTGTHKAFELGLYWNQMTATTTADGDLTLGIGINDGLEACWMPFDNFRLYYGAEKIAVDLTEGVPTEDTKASTVTTGITLNAGEYNKVCLPFDLDETKTAATFSHVYTLAGVTSDGVGQLVPAYSIEAGKAYFVTVDATTTLTVNDVLVKVAQPDSIPVMWEGAATVGNYNGFTFTINGSAINSFAPVDFQNMSFVVNQENWRVRRFLSEVNYTDASVASKVRDYNEGHPIPLDHPHSVFIPVPQNNAALTVTVSKNADYSEAETFTFPAGTTLCEVPNLIPQNTYYYKVEGGSVLTQGQFQTEGHLRMIKTISGFNIRDLGGWMNLDGNRVRYGKIFRGGELNIGHDVSADDLAELCRLGIGAEIDLRDDADCGGTSPTESALGSDVAYLYMNQDYNSNMFVTHQEDYNRMFNFTLNNLREGKAVYFHCRIGADRTGSYGLLLDGLCGMTFDQLCKEYELTTFSEAGTRPWDDTGWLNMHEKLEYIQTLPGSTLQRQFFYYFNTEVGIPADDLFDFIDIMVGDATSLENCDLTFNDLSNAYLQSLDEVGASCSLGSTVKEGAKAQLSDGETTIPLDMTIDNITVTFSEVTLEPGKYYTITIPAGSIEKEGVENAAEALTSFHTPVVFDGIYYLYSPYYDGFISGGQAYGTSVVVDNYGMPFEWKVDRNTGYSKIRFISSDLYLYGPNWVFIDGLSDDARIYDVLPSTDAQLSGYYLHDRGLDDGYLYTRKPDKSNPRAVASNGSYEDRGSDCCTWQFWTKAERDAKVNGYPAQNIETVIAASGINATATTFATVLDTDYTSIDRSSAVGTTSFGNGVGNWTFTSTSTTDGYPDYNNREGNAYGRCYETTGVHTLTIPAANVPAGIYKVELGAFERHTNEAIDTRMWNDGFTDPVSAYLAANDEQVPFMSWYQMNQNADANGQTAVYVGQSLTQQAAFIAAGYADICLYIYLDGETDLTLKIADPNRVWNGSAHYVVFNNLRLTQYLPNVTLDETAAEAPQAAKNVNLTFKRTIVAKDNVESNNAWNTICFPFALTQSQIQEAFGANTVVKQLKSVTVNGDNANLTFEAVNDIAANTPYIMQVETGASEYTFQGIDITPSEDLTQTVGDLQFVGNYIYPCVMANNGGTDYYILNDLFKSSTGRTKIKGFRAYFHVPESSGIKSIGFDEGEATGIESLNDFNETKDLEVYDLSGRRVQNPTKGFYIINGKKTFVK